MIKTNLARMVEIAEKRDSYSSLLAEARKKEASPQLTTGYSNNSDESRNVSKQYLDCFGSNGLRMRFK